MWDTVAQYIAPALLSAAIAGLVAYLLGRGRAEVEPEKLKADAAAALTSAASEFIDDLRQEMARQAEVVRCQSEQIAALRLRDEEQQRRISALEREVRRWERRYRALCEWVRAQGLDPDQMDLVEDDGADAL
jgi:hypothetical protein